MRITFVQTGGTIDKDYPRATGGYAFEFGEPATARLLARWPDSASAPLTSGLSAAGSAFR